MAFSFAFLRPVVLASVPILKSFVSRAFSSKNSARKVRNILLYRINWYKTQKYLPPNPQIQGWVTPGDPTEARWRLKCLRIRYYMQCRDIRKQWYRELKEETRVKIRRQKASSKIARPIISKRKDEKSVCRKTRFSMTKKREVEFQKVLKKEREEKLEYWRKRQEARKERKKVRFEALRRRSAYWVDEHELEERILKALTDITPL